MYCFDLSIKKLYQRLYLFKFAVIDYMWSRFRKDRLLSRLFCLKTIANLDLVGKNKKKRNVVMKRVGQEYAERDTIIYVKGERDGKVLANRHESEVKDDQR